MVLVVPALPVVGAAEGIRWSALGVPVDTVRDFMRHEAHVNTRGEFSIAVGAGESAGKAIGIRNCRQVTGRISEMHTQMLREVPTE